MKLRVENKPKVSILYLNGKFTMDDSDTFENQYNEVLEKSPTAIAIDCAKLDFIDSSAIGSMIKCLNHSKRTATNLHLLNVSDNILNVFKLARLDLFFSILTSEEFTARYPGASDDEIDSIIDNL